MTKLYKLHIVRVSLSRYATKCYILKSKIAVAVIDSDIARVKANIEDLSNTDRSRTEGMTKEQNCY